MRSLRNIAVGVLLLSLIACSSTAQEAPVSAGKIVYGLSISVSGIDPHINQSSELGIVLRQVYDTLVYRHPENAEFVPGLAERWTISEDGLNYTFYLRDDVQFHDGTPFNAAAVAANIDRITDPDLRSQKARPLLGPLVSYQVIDDYTIRLTLSEPFAPLLDSLSQVYLGIASPQALAEYSNLRYQYHQVGTGPFEFVEYLPEDRIVIRRNPDYAWGPEFYGSPGENAIQEVEFRFFRDPATRALALENGEADIMGELLPLDARALFNNNEIDLMPIYVPGQPLQYYMNTQQFPTDNLAVRQALLYGTNRTAIVDAVFQGFSPVAWGPLSRETQFYNPNVLGVYSYDVLQAQNLLRDAGYADSDDDGILDLDGVPLEITLIAPSWGLVPDVSQLLQDQWRTLGIRTIIEPVPGYTGLIEAIQEGEYNLASFDTFGMDPVFLNAYFLSTGANNWTGYADVQLDDALLTAARATTDAARAQAYGQAQAIIMSQALILPIRDYVNLNARRVRVDGIRFDPYGWFPLLNDAYLVE